MLKKLNGVLNDVNGQLMQSQAAVLNAKYCIA